MKRLPKGCGYQGYEYGARSYPDSLCCGGRLYDADELEELAEEIPCPNCREEEAVEYWFDRFALGGEDPASARDAANNFVAHIRRKCVNGPEQCTAGEWELSM
jgi:hypothetical protein